MPYTNLTDFCTAIANAIRNKTGSVEPINAQSFPQAINSLNVSNEVSDLGVKMYSFGVVSDIHMGYFNGSNDFDNAMQYFDGKVDFVCCSGDIRSSTYSASDATELIIYKNIIDNYSFPTYTCTGNHDMACSENVWKENTGCDRNFVIEHQNDVFIFASLDIETFSSTSDNPYAQTLVWLEQQLDRYSGCRIFLFMHYPPTSYSGLTSGQYYGFSQSSTEDDTLITLLNRTKNVTMFHGHTHYSFECEGYIDTMNVYRFNNTHVSLIHVPSTAYCKNKDGENETDVSQGYLVDVYENGFVINGVDFAEEKILEDYTYMFSVKNEEIKNSIVLSKSEISLEEGQTDTFTVKLSNGAGVVNISSNNNYATVSPSVLTFTNDNYSNEQEVTVTSTSNIGSSASVSSVITVSSNNVTSKTVSVTVVEQIIQCESVSLDKNEITFTEIGETQTITATKSPLNTTHNVIWTSSNNNVATVSNGVVTSVGNGSATITATCGTQTATCSVLVNHQSQSDDLTLSYDYGLKIDTTTGAETTGQSNYGASNYVSIEDGKTYHLLVNYFNGLGVRVAYYDDSNNYLSCTENISSNYDSDLSIPLSAAYLRIRVQVNGLLTNTTAQGLVESNIVVTKQ